MRMCGWEWWRPEGGPTRWMDIGETRSHLLARVYWAPDSRAVAYERLNRVQNRLDLGLADVRTGASRVLLTRRFVLGQRERRFPLSQ